MNATGDAIEDATRDAIGGATWAATWAADLSNWYVIGDNFRSCQPLLGDRWEFGLRCAASAYRMWQGGNQWSGYDSYLTFFRHIAKLSLDYSAYDHWEKLSLHSGPRIVHQDFCMISDRPIVLLVDAENRPHCDDGPFCRWSDGSALYSVHGVRVPAYVVERPQDITVEKIQAEGNAEVRRVMIDRYKRGEEIVGAAAYLRDGKAERLDHDEQWGTLWRMPVGDDEPIVCVEVVNRTPEPDGHFKHYFLRCDPQLRPLRPEGGKPQKLTALNAVASTFGLTGAQYAKELEFES